MPRVSPPQVPEYESEVVPLTYQVLTEDPSDVVRASVALILALLYASTSMLQFAEAKLCIAVSGVVISGCGTHTDT